MVKNQRSSWCMECYILHDDGTGIVSPKVRHGIVFADSQKFGRIALCEYHLLDVVRSQPHRYRDIPITINAIEITRTPYDNRYGYIWLAEGDSHSRAFYPEAMPEEGDIGRYKLLTHPYLGQPLTSDLLFSLNTGDTLTAYFL